MLIEGAIERTDLYKDVEERVNNLLEQRRHEMEDLVQKILEETSNTKKEDVQMEAPSDNTKSENEDSNAAGTKTHDQVTIKETIKAGIASLETQKDNDGDIEMGDVEVDGGNIKTDKIDPGDSLDMRGKVQEQEPMDQTLDVQEPTDVATKTSPIIKQEIVESEDIPMEVHEPEPTTDTIVKQEKGEKSQDEATDKSMNIQDDISEMIKQEKDKATATSEKRPPTSNSEKKSSSSSTTDYKQPSKSDDKHIETSKIAKSSSVLSKPRHSSRERSRDRERDRGRTNRDSLDRSTRERSPEDRKRYRERSPDDRYSNHHLPRHRDDSPSRRRYRDRSEDDDIFVF